MSAKMYPLAEGFLKAEWMCDQTQPFPAYSGYGSALILKAGDKPIIVMCADKDRLLSICQSLTPDGTIDPLRIHPIVLTHMNNVKLVDDEL